MYIYIPVENASSEDIYVYIHICVHICICSIHTHMYIHIYVYIYVYVHICHQKTVGVHGKKKTQQRSRGKNTLYYTLYYTQKTKNQTCFGVAFEERQIVPPVFFCCQRVRVRENAGGRRDGHIECGRCHLCTCMHLYVYLYALLCVLVSTFMCTLLQPKA